MAWVSTGIAVVGGAAKMIGAGSAKRQAQREQKAAQRRLNSLEANRQEILNPYEEAASQLTNPFANLTVATGAAEMQAQQADLSLASSLDTLRATGSGAGGATALAMAAMQSKQGVSASIQQQEAQNQKLRAQGQQQMESQRAKLLGSGEASRQAMQEQREMGQLDRAASEIDVAQQQAMTYANQESAGMGELIGGVASGVAAGIETGKTVGADGQIVYSKNRQARIDRRNARRAE